MELKLGILILGDTNVGKTSLLLNYTDNYYVGSHVATVGIDYKFKTIKIKDIDVKLQIWDTSGQERFRSLAKNYLKNADGIIFVYDITDKKTFEGVKDWIKEAESHGIYKQILVGNKCDLERKREVTTDMLNKLGNKKKIKTFETSAKTGINVSKSFESLAELLVEGKSKEELNNLYRRETIKITGIKNNKKSEKKECCK